MTLFTKSALFYYAFFNRQDQSVALSKSNLSTSSKVCYFLGLLLVVGGAVLPALCFYGVLSGCLAPLIISVGIAVFLLGIIFITVAWVLSIKKSCKVFKNLEENIKQSQKHYSAFFDKEQQFRLEKLKFYSDQLVEIEKEAANLDKGRILQEFASSPECNNILKICVDNEANKFQSRVNQLSRDLEVLQEKMDRVFYFYSKSSKRKQR